MADDAGLHVVIDATSAGAATAIGDIETRLVALETAFNNSAAAAVKQTEATEASTLSLGKFTTAANSMARVSSAAGVEVGTLAGRFIALGDSLEALGAMAPELIAIGAAIAVISAGVEAFTGGISSASETQDTLETIGMAVKNQGGDWEAAEKQVDAWATAMSEATRFSRGEALTAINDLIQAGNSLADSEKITAISADVATATHRSLIEVVDLVKSAEEGRGMGLEKLDSRVKAIIQSHGTLSQLLEQLETDYSGAATKADSYDVAVAKMQHAFGNLAEELGKVLIPALTATANAMTAFLHDIEGGLSGLKTWWDDVAAAIDKAEKTGAAAEEGQQKRLARMHPAAKADSGFWSGLASEFQHWGTPSKGEHDRLERMLKAHEEAMKRIVVAAKHTADASKTITESATQPLQHDMQLGVNQTGVAAKSQADDVKDTIANVKQLISTRQIDYEHAFAAEDKLRSEYKLTAQEKQDLDAAERSMYTEFENQNISDEKKREEAEKAAAAAKKAALDSAFAQEKTDQEDAVKFDGETADQLIANISRWLKAHSDATTQMKMELLDLESTTLKSDADTEIALIESKKDLTNKVIEEDKKQLEWLAATYLAMGAAGAAAYRAIKDELDKLNVKETDNTKKATEDYQKSIDEQMKATDELSKKIVDTFEKARSNSKGIWAGIVDDFKSMVKQIETSLVESAIGSLLSGSQKQGTGGGGFSLQSLLPGNLGQNLGISEITKNTATIVKNTAAIAAGVGTVQGADGAQGVTNTDGVFGALTGSGSGPLSKFLGSTGGKDLTSGLAGYGIGSSLGSALDPSANQEWQAVGGSIGAGIGAFFGGPAGSEAGGAVGSFLGGLFGPHETKADQPDINDPTYQQLYANLIGQGETFNGNLVEPGNNYSSYAGNQDMSAQIYAYISNPANLASLNPQQQATIQQMLALYANAGPQGLAGGSESQGNITLPSGKTISVTSLEQLIANEQLIQGSSSSNYPVFNVERSLPGNAWSLSAAGTYDPKTGQSSGAPTNGITAPGLRQLPQIVVNIASVNSQSTINTLTAQMYDTWRRNVGGTSSNLGTVG